MITASEIREEARARNLALFGQPDRPAGAHTSWDGDLVPASSLDNTSRVSGVSSGYPDADAYRDAGDASDQWYASDTARTSDVLPLRAASGSPGGSAPVPGLSQREHAGVAPGAARAARSGPSDPRAGHCAADAPPLPHRGVGPHGDAGRHGNTGPRADSGDRPLPGVRSEPSREAGSSLPADVDVPRGTSTLGLQFPGSDPDLDEYVDWLAGQEPDPDLDEYVDWLAGQEPPLADPLEPDWDES